MNEKTPFDFVWLGVLIGTFDLGDRERGIEEIRALLTDIGLSNTADKLDQASDNLASVETDTIASWVADELRDKPTVYGEISETRFFDTTDLIESMTPGVFGGMPPFAQRGFTEAAASIRNGTPNGAASTLCRCVEAMVITFHQRLLPNSAADLTWADREKELFTLAQGERDLLPAINFAKAIRLDHRNPGAHPDKEYDEWEARRLWFLAVEAVTRMVHALEKRFRPPGMA